MDVCVVNHGVDTLVVNAYYTDAYGKPFKRELDDVLAQRCEEWKKEAQIQGGMYATPCVFNGLVLHMCPNGAGHGQWPWMLKTRDITLYISRGQWNGIASVRFNSDFLWSSRRLLDAVIQVQVFLDELFQDEMYLQVSSIDLCADVAGWSDIDQLDRRRDFVSRSRKRSVHTTPDWGYDAELREYSYGLQGTGFEFSRGGPLSCTIYDKSREIIKSGKEWFEDAWRAHGWSEDLGKVWRVEMKYKREALHELLQEKEGTTVFHGVEDAYSLPDLLPLLWSYGVGHPQGGSDGLPDGWLRCVVPGKDKTRSRWPTHPAWKVVQGAFLRSTTLPEDFGKIIRKRHEQHNVERGLEAVMGYLTSLSAWNGGELAEEGVDLSVVLHWLANKGQEYLDRVDRDFSAEVARKRLKAGL